MARQKLDMGMPPVHPGEFVRTEILDELNLSIARAAKALNVRAATLSDLVNEKASLSPEMALRIELAFGVKAELLLRMQALYDSMVIRDRAGDLNVRRYQPGTV
ncbi:MAG: HigA family addiction module antitoxin [Alphaproteobacteria bacterium]